LLILNFLLPIIEKDEPQIYKLIHFKTLFIGGLLNKSHVKQRGERNRQQMFINFFKTS